MKYDFNDEKNSVKYIQRILRDLDYLENGKSTICVNGVYNERTKNAVKKYQKLYGLEADGKIDGATWNLLNSIHKAQTEDVTLARAFYLFPRYKEYSILPGQKDNIMYTIQHMLDTVSQNYDTFGSININGIYDEKTQNAVKIFQRSNLIDDNGIIDAVTFNKLADEYEDINSSEK